MPKKSTSEVGKLVCNDPRCALLAPHAVAGPGCTATRPKAKLKLKKLNVEVPWGPDTPPTVQGTLSGLTISLPGFISRPVGPTLLDTLLDTPVTVFQAKGRRVTTRAKEERGGGRRNASRAKSVPRCLTCEKPNLDIRDGVCAACRCDKQLPWASKFQLCCFDYPDCTCRRSSPAEVSAAPKALRELNELKEAVRELFAADEAHNQLYCYDSADRLAAARRALWKLVEL